MKNYFLILLMALAFCIVVLNPGLLSCKSKFTATTYPGHFAAYGTQKQVIDSLCRDSCFVKTDSSISFDIVIEVHMPDQDTIYYVRKEDSHFDVHILSSKAIMNQIQTKVDEPKLYKP